ncbi:MAG: peptidylprolyl isomerase, partial [Rhodococcus sp.]|nr:peptidylprolyl isomerase [Rhodococcus sp. (in: high G+C Gram-positive bacteria)]
MPSNAQRRQAAKRKLERQLERRAERERKRRRRNIGLGALGAIVVIGAAVALWAVDSGDDDTATTASEETEQTTEYTALPAGRAEPLPESVSCAYPANGLEPSRPVEPPRTEGILTSGEAN